ncbi:penicillin-binding transpeptidase domain-containing protein [bacterium endosymbiont of Pedicinus badii]|uniref:penicillin-binding transpeptidase domain-containing protein n=1 Tax=bacterium endosymbiont of Pedicinus badii TaxID=1719126 RepID=UPI0009B9F17C|nr:penicillin-binding transpeptidase domain-containing protein [bacterium endosymbiont of Pedicinus badii]OQM34214.1 hypothetical protein AOQ89_02680 [bacterium endosymbiont of Pedicinus badii]
MANFPSYNPNNFSFLRVKNMRNRAITDLLEPGSTIKPIIVIAALENGIVKKNSIINTIPYKIDGHLVEDVSYNEKLTLSGILKKSSNVGISKLALAIPFDKILKIYKEFGIGESTNLGIIGEKFGFFPKKKFFSEIERASFSYGYGFMVTPLQIARLYAIIGSLGIKKPLSILKLENPAQGKRIISEEIAIQVLKMMEIQNTNTSTSSYKIAAKTGTVRKVKNKRYIKKYISYTAGIAPIENPMFSLVIVINDPKNGKYYGSMVALPVFKNIMENALKNTSFFSKKE